MAAWMEQQAAEYADLVGSFVESVVDSETDEMIEYQLIWEGGDLGVALTPLETEATGVQVSRVTGKGFPFGIKNVGPGDILLSINLVDTTKLALDEVVGFLQECDLPATLRFKKVSPDMDKATPPPRPSVPRHSQFVVTSSTTNTTGGPTSPMGSAPPPIAAARNSAKAQAPVPVPVPVPGPGGPSQQRQSAQSRASTQSRPSSHGRPSHGRPSVPYEHPTGLPSPPPPAKPAQAPVPVPQQQSQPPAPVVVVPVAAAKKAVDEQKKTTTTTVEKTKTKTTTSTVKEKKKPTPAPVVVTTAAVAATPSSPKKETKTPVPVVAKASTVEPVAAKTPVEPAVAIVAAPPATLSHAMSKEVEEIMMMGTASNDLGFDDESSDESSDDEALVAAAAAAAVAAPSFNEAIDDDAFVVTDAHEEEKEDDDDETKQAFETYDEDESVLPQTRQKSSSSVAMLGHYSIATTTVPILPEVAEAHGIEFIDNVSESHESASPSASAYAVGRPSDVRGGRSSTPSSPVGPPASDSLPRESIRMTMDGGAEPMMASQPIGTLHELCAKGNLRGVVQVLRVDGPDGLIAREPNHGQTGLHLAVKSGNVQLVKLMLEQFKPLEDLVNLEDDKGNTPLHFAATKTPAMVHALLESGGASANVKNSRKLTPLIISVITSRDDSVIVPRMLLKFGANPNDMHESHTVIHTAIASGRLQIAGALVKAGAKMDVEDADGKNVFEKLDRKATKLLLAHIYFPPTYITEKERQECMVCHKKIKFGHRKVNCTHCGRLCCSECCALAVEMYKFPMGFPGRTRRGAAVRDPKRVCKTCYAIFKERLDEPEKATESKFMSRVIGIEWDEVNPNKLAKSRGAGRRGEKE